VHDVAFGWVTLQGLDDDVLLGAVNVQLDDVAVGRFVFEQFGISLASMLMDSGLFRHRKQQLEPGLRDDAGGGSHLSQVGTHFSIQSKIVHFVSPK
jgi:hypothetical protein